MPETNPFPDFNPKEFGHNVGRLREFRGYTQPDFAQLLGFSSRTLQHIEAGTSEVSLSNAFKIAKTLQVPLSQLLHLNENAIVNSFNNIQQDATSMAYSNYRVEADKEHIQTLQSEMAFRDRLVDALQSEKAELRAENLNLRQKLGWS